MPHHKNIRIFLAIGVLKCLLLFAKCDLPCKARDVGIDGRSIVCVCDATYCDTVTRNAPKPGSYVTYTSTRAGKRFEKGGGVIESDSYSKKEGRKSETYGKDDISENIKPRNLNDASYRLFPNVQFQTIEGFGGSVTDAAGVNWRKLSFRTQTYFINSYFARDGLEYNLIRVPIGGADFSTHPYTYNEYPWNDAALSNFSLTIEDYYYKLPLIKRAQAVATTDIKITASTWSPPIWMKTNKAITGFAQVKPEYYQSYADYHIRFMEEYEKANVKIWSLTTTNEPINGIVPFVDFNSVGWFPWDLGRWVANNLGPTLRSSRFNDTLIFAVDDQRYLLDIYLQGMIRAAPKSLDYIDGIAIHYYGNFIPASILSNIQERYPGKLLLSTEACEGPMPWDIMRVKVGSWERAARYTRHILDDINNFVIGWIDWNLCLDDKGGPNWAHNYVDAPILVYGDKDEFIKQPMFYAMGHFSKFMPRGSKRIQVLRRSLGHVENLAVLTPEGNIVVLLHNANVHAMNVRLSVSLQNHIDLTVEPESITTIEINPQSN
ncbi:lysosomal acid glucosylceramidase-like [Maniola hyperantus]|uniref:lysosomal acid glucosylceramidase-like n=1 Tax=Aphantopus hyperantus TaxID=2795564 RepID=UPI0015688BE1|nr:lysosomal acid glucosylceramidase-like [Maniola hyperantus]